MKILVVNAGSSSLKYQLIDMEGEKVIAKGQVERIAIEGGHLKQTSADKRWWRSPSLSRTTWKPRR